MKSKLYAVGAVCLSILIGIVSVFISRNRSDKGRVANFKDSLDESKMKMHRKSANESFKEAKAHLSKAKDIEARRESEKSESADDAVMKWNDDKM